MDISFGYLYIITLNPEYVCDCITLTESFILPLVMGMKVMLSGFNSGFNKTIKQLKRKWGIETKRDKKEKCACECKKIHLRN